MKKTLMVTAIALASAALTGADMLTDREWKFSKTWNAAGNLTKLADGSWQLENTGNAGSITMHCAESEYTVTPGRHYQIIVDMEHSSPGIKSQLLTALPGARRVRKPELRTPMQTGKRAAIEFITRPDERRLALYLSLSGTGKTIVKSVKIEEIDPGNDLIKRPGINWNFIAAPGAQGKMTRLDDGSLQIEKTGGKAHVMGYLTLPLPIKPGRSYLVTMTGKRSVQSARWGLMSHSGSQKSWPSRPAAGKAGELEKVSLTINTADSDNGLRIYAVLHGTGVLEVKSITVEELSTRKEILAGRIWTGNPKTAGTAVKGSDGSWILEKKSDKGILVFAHHGFVKVVPGRHYLIEWLADLAPGQVANSMVYLPSKPKPRTPWPVGKVVSAAGRVKVSQLVTIREGEKEMRVNLVISGKTGKTTVKSSSITELDDEELKKLQQAK
ncbi:MAG: hypothetical protein IKC82_07845 [Lentisphaeria bacterium]|nr:hypothetical protein [Lentisphaeria bacterium]